MEQMKKLNVILAKEHEEIQKLLEQVENTYIPTVRP